MRKIFLLLIAAFALVSMQTSKEDRKQLLCAKWRQYAYKSRSDSAAKSVSASMAKLMTFKNNGDYEEELITSHGKGKWRFNDAQTKLGFTFSEFNGINMQSQDTSIETNIIILKLNRDTLIYGTEGLYGGMAKNDHDDWYFVREK